MLEVWSMGYLNTLPHPTPLTKQHLQGREGKEEVLYLGEGGGRRGGGPISDYVIVLVRVRVTFLSRVLRPTYKLIMQVSAAILRGRPPGNPWVSLGICSKNMPRRQGH